MSLENKQSTRIAQLNQYPEDIETVVGWIFDQWGHSPRETITDLLVRNEACPPSLIAVSSTGPVGVLGYKLHLLPDGKQEALWINVLYVVPIWQGQGIGSQLLREGMLAAVTAGRNALYVYTDIPTYYEKRGWRRFRYNDDTKMHVLEYRPNVQMTTA